MMYVEIQDGVIPDGYEVVRYGLPKRGECFLSPRGGAVDGALFDFEREAVLILRKKLPVYREPTADDVGRAIEVRRAGEDKWEIQHLLAILPEDQNVRFVATNQRGWCGYVDARVDAEG